MDADWIDRPRETLLSRREKRWSMNSQRLEAVLAQLLKPISTDNRRSFDTDQSALLEEYLTEAGLRVLEAAESEEAASLAVELPNFAEVALVLQQSVANYSRKVDCLYENVVQVCVSIQNCTKEQSNDNSISVAPEEPQIPTTNRRKRKASSSNVINEFVEIELETCSNATREVEWSRAPPTLPRLYLELEPRLMSALDMPLSDYQHEHIGMLTDFQVAWRLHDGMLVDELQGGRWCGGGALRALSLLELQAAVRARAPPSPPRSRSSSPLPSPPLLPLHHSTPLPKPPPPPPLDTTAATRSSLKKDRKRLSGVKLDNLFNDSLSIIISKEAKCKLLKVQEFSIDKMWIQSVVKKRKSNILQERKRLLQETPPDKDFLGWSLREASQAKHASRSLREVCSDFDSDDDGFFEQSGDDDDGLGGPRLRPAPPPIPPDAALVEAARAVDEARQAEEEARVEDVTRVLEETAVTDATRLTDHTTVTDETRVTDVSHVTSEMPAKDETCDKDETRATEGTRVTRETSAVADSGLDPEAEARAAALAAWREEVLQRAAESEARGPPNVRALADQVLGALHEAEEEPRPFTELLHQEAHHPTDVSRLLLATLFLANSGNVEIVQEEGPRLDNFSVRLLDTDTSRYAQEAAAAEDQFS